MQKVKYIRCTECGHRMLPNMTSRVEIRVANGGRLMLHKTIRQYRYKCQACGSLNYFKIRN